MMRRLLAIVLLAGMAGGCSALQETAEDRILQRMSIIDASLKGLETATTAFVNSGPAASAGGMGGLLSAILTAAGAGIVAGLAARQPGSKPRKEEPNVSGV